MKKTHQKPRRILRKAIAMLLCCLMALYAMPLEAAAAGLADLRQEAVAEAAAELTPPVADEAQIAELDSEADTEPYVLYEDTEKRTGTSKEYRMSDGSFTVTEYGDAVHYYEDNQWKEIDNTLKVQGDEYINRASDVRFSFSTDTTALPSFGAALDKYSVSFTGVDETARVEPESAAAEDAALAEDDIADAEEVLPEHDRAPEAAEPQSASDALGEQGAALQDQLPVAAENEASSSAANAEAAPWTPEIAPDAICEIALQNPVSERAALAAEEQTIERVASADTYSSAISYSMLDAKESYAYVLKGRNLKESIVVTEPKTAYRYLYRLDLKELTPTLLTDGSVSLRDGSKEIFQIPAPYMFDENGEESTAASYTLTEKSDGSWLLTLTADKTWINAADRAFPVTIDPTIYATQHNSANITTEFVSDDDMINRHQNEALMYVGRNFYDDNVYAHVRINTLPALPYNTRFCKAWLFLATGNVIPVSTQNTVNSFYLFAQGSIADWPNQFVSTTNNNPVLDYAMLNNNTTSVLLDVTQAADNWYANASSNYGITLYAKNTDNTDMNSSKSAYAALGGYQTGLSSCPVFAVSFTNINGIEDYFSAQTQSIGRAGTAYVSDYTGNMTLIHPDITDDAYTLSHVYNAFYGERPFTNGEVYHTVNYSSMVIGNGWRLNAQESIVNMTFTQPNGVTGEYLIYSDGDGTEHYFTYFSPEVFQDEDGLGLKITRSISSAYTTYTMTDDKNNRRMFINGYLIKIIDSNDNANVFLYNNSVYNAAGTNWYPLNSGANRLTSIIHKDDAKTQYTVATLQYNAAGQLTSVKDRYLRTTSFTFDSNNYITMIGEPDAAYMYYRYNGVYNRISDIFDGESQTGLMMKYETGNKLTGLYPYTATGITVPESSKTKRNIVGCNYSSPGLTKIRDLGNNNVVGGGDDILYTYVFDDYGRTVSVSGVNSDGDTVCSSGGSYTANSGTAKTNNRLLSEGNAGMTAQNLLWGGDAETNSWGNMTLSPGVFDNSYYTLDKKSGSRSIRTNLENSSTSSSVYRAVDVTTTGTYTLTAYVKTNPSNFHPGNQAYSGARLQVEQNLVPLTPIRQDILNKPTDTTINNGWQRITTVVTINTEGKYLVRLVLNKCTGTVFWDEIQISKGDGECSFNYINNSNFENGIADAIFASEATESGGVTQHTGIEGKVLKLSGAPNKESVYAKNIPLTLEANQAKQTTFMLSGWASANSLPLSLEGRTFDIKAVLTYSGGSTQTETGKFNPAIRGAWQFVCVPIVPNKNLDITSIRIECSYKKNGNTAAFDDLSLIMEPCATYQYNENGKLEAVNSTNKDEMSFQYSGANLITSAGGANGTLTYQYDSAHNITKAVSGNLNMTMEYDATGKATKTKLKGSNDVAYMETTASYTGDGNHVSASTDNLGNTTSFTYNNATFGNLSTATAPSSSSISTNTNVATNYLYENNDRSSLTYVTGVSSLNTSYTKGNIGAIERGGYIPGNTTKQSQVYSFNYDAWGNRTRSKVGGTTLATYTYGNNGNTLDQMLYGNGDKVLYTYDNLNRVKTKTIIDQYIDDEDEEVHYETKWILTYYYDGSNRVSKVYVKNGSNVLQSTIETEYDTLDRLMRSDEYAADGSLKQSVKNVYDNKNRLTHYYYYDGEKTVLQRNEYNNNGTTSVFHPANNDAITFTYDSLNRIEKKTTAHDSNATYAFDVVPKYKTNTSTNQTTSLVTEYKYDYQAAQEANGVYDYNTYYEYDNLGNITHSYSRTRTSVSGGQYPITENGVYKYNKQNQMVLEEVYGDTVAYTNVYTYDSYGNIRNVKKMPDYGYASVEIVGDAIGAGVQPLDSVNYTYGNSDWLDLMTAYDGHTITYDSIGNPLTYYNGTRYNMSWANGRELQSMTSNPNAPNASTVSFTYDENGQRTTKTAGNRSYTYTYVGGKLTFYRCVNGSFGYTLNFIYDESGAPQSMYLNDVENTNTKFYFVLNAQGDVVQLRDKTNKAVANYSYDAWGKLLSVTDEAGAVFTNPEDVALRNPLRYRGYVYDTETGLYYVSSRYYDPETCRFINADGYVSTGDDILGFNMFAYCMNNPINMIDETGCDPVPIWAKHIIAGTATEAEYAKALSSNASAWAGSAGYTVRKAVSLAQEHQSYLIASAEHHKKGTTNPSNRKRHEDGQARKQRDNNGEKKNNNPNWKPNPNKRNQQNSEINIGINERITSVGIAIGATLCVAYLVANDATIIGAVDDAAIAPLLPIIWDNAIRAIS